MWKLGHQWELVFIIYSGKKGGNHSVMWIKREKAVVLWFRMMPHLVGSSKHLNNFCSNRLLKNRILETWIQNFSTKWHFCWNREKKYIFLVCVVETVLLLLLLLLLFYEYLKRCCIFCILLKLCLLLFWWCFKITRWL